MFQYLVPSSSFLYHRSRVVIPQNFLCTFPLLRLPPRTAAGHTRAVPGVRKSSAPRVWLAPEGLRVGEVRPSGFRGRSCPPVVATEICGAENILVLCEHFPRRLPHSADPIGIFLCERQTFVCLEDRRIIGSIIGHPGKFFVPCSRPQGRTTGAVSIVHVVSGIRTRGDGEGLLLFMGLCIRLLGEAEKVILERKFIDEHERGIQDPTLEGTAVAAERAVLARERDGTGGEEAHDARRNALSPCLRRALAVALRKEHFTDIDVVPVYRCPLRYEHDGGVIGECEADADAVSLSRGERVTRPNDPVRIGRGGGGGAPPLPAVGTHGEGNGEGFLTFVEAALPVAVS